LYFYILLIMVFIAVGVELWDMGYIKTVVIITHKVRHFTTY
jgi:hypothetical protein